MRATPKTEPAHHYRSTRLPFRLQIKEQLGLYYAREAQKLSSRMTLLDAYSPLAVLKRGYTLVEQDGMLCKSASALQQESEVRIRFHDGKWRAKLLEKEEDHEGKINI